MARKDYYYDKNAPKANSIVPAASAIVTNSEGKLLMHKRRDNNLWSLLGGGMEPGESISDTIIREVKEESGFDVKIQKLVGIYSNPNHVIEYTNGEIRQQFSICFHCEIISGQMSLSDESYELKFFKVEELKTINMHEAQVVRINDYLQSSIEPFLR